MSEEINKENKNSGINTKSVPIKYFDFGNSKSKNLDLIRNRFVKGKLSMSGYDFRYYSGSQEFSFGCFRINIDKFKQYVALFDRAAAGEELSLPKTTYIVTKKSIEKGKITRAKTRVFKEESDTFYISTTKKVYLKSEHELRELEPELLWELPKPGDKTIKVRQDGWGNYNYVTVKKFPKIAQTILEYIDFMNDPDTKANIV